MIFSDGNIGDPPFFLMYTIFSSIIFCMQILFKFILHSVFHRNCIPNYWSVHSLGCLCKTALIYSTDLLCVYSIDLILKFSWCLHLRARQRYEEISWILLLHMHHLPNCILCVNHRSNQLHQVGIPITGSRLITEGRSWKWLGGRGELVLQGGIEKGPAIDKAKGESMHKNFTKGNAAEMVTFLMIFPFL